MHAGEDISPHALDHNNMHAGEDRQDLQASQKI